MNKCYNCGAEYEGNYCPDCGVPAPAPPPELANTSYSDPYSSTNMNSSQQYYNNSSYGNFNPTKSETTSMGSWLGWLFLTGFLGIIGTIIMLCASNNESEKNFAKAQLIFYGIAIVIAILFISFISAIAASLN